MLTCYFLSQSLLSGTAVYSYSYIMTGINHEDSSVVAIPLPETNDIILISATDGTKYCKFIVFQCYIKI